MIISSYIGKERSQRSFFSVVYLWDVDFKLIFVFVNAYFRNLFPEIFVRFFKLFINFLKFVMLYLQLLILRLSLLSLGLEIVDYLCKLFFAVCIDLSGRGSFSLRRRYIWNCLIYPVSVT